MRLYLIRHAEAKTEQEDPAKPLSIKGLNDVTKTALFMSHAGIEIARIFHSKKLRAKQTAEVMAQYLKPAKGMTEAEGLAPLEDPAFWAKRLEDFSDVVMLVGHLPYLAKLTALLLCGNTAAGSIAFRSAGVVCLDRDEAGVWSLQWMLIPDIIA